MKPLRSPSSRVLLSGAAALLVSPLAAQTQVAPTDVLSDYEYAGHFRYIVATGEILPEPLEVQPPEGNSCANAIINVLLNLDRSSAYLTPFLSFERSEYIDWGVISTQTESDIVPEFTLGYATTDLDTSLGGPGATIEFSFYEGYAGPCVVGQDIDAMEVASFRFTGLPGWPGSGPALGHLVTFDLRGGSEFVLPEGPLGLGYRVDFATNGGTGPIQCFAGNPDGSTTVPDARGQVTGLDRYDLDSGGGCFGTVIVGSDGSTGIPVGSHYLLLRKSNAAVTTPASAVVRNDSLGQNPLALLPGGTPVLSQPFSFVAAATAPGQLGIFLAGYLGATELPTSLGTLLVDVAHPAGELLAGVGVAGPHSYTNGFVGVTVQSPTDVTLCGLDLFVQAAEFGTALRLTNALDLTFGLR